MDSLDKYGKKYPELVYDIIMFYANSDIKSIFAKNLHGVNPDLGYKCPLDFCVKNENKYKELDDPNVMIQPRIIKKICDILCSNNYLSSFVSALFNNMDDLMVFYHSFRKTDFLKIPKEMCVNLLNNTTYGFKYIYHASRKNVLPIFLRKGDEQFMGTCFKTINGIITAKHCIEYSNPENHQIEPFDAVQIDTLSSNFLNGAKITTNYNMDIVMIRPEQYQYTECFLIEKGEVLDEVMTLGFPQHGGFNNFLTATVGSIAAIEYSYIYKHELMLLTTKLKGGNSGGPVINKNGCVVGLITETQMSEGKQYDQFEYGMAIPLDNIDKILVEEYSKTIKFVDEI